MTIKIYTNMNNADLYVNGKLIKTLSGEKVLRQVIYVLKGIEGLNDDYAILGIKPVDSNIELEG